MAQTTIRILGPNVNGEFCIYDTERGAWDGCAWRKVGYPKPYTDWRQAWADASALAGNDTIQTSCATLTTPRKGVR